MIIDRIRKDMTVIAADDCCVGFVGGLEGPNRLRITSVSTGYGYDHLIPLAWVSDVNKYVYLDKASGYVAANWESAPLLRRKSPVAREKPVADGIEEAAVRPAAA